jgi:predicted nucleotide-binding protein
MANRHYKYETPPTGAPSVTPQVGINLLKKQIERGESLLAARPFDNVRYSAWENTTREFLVKAFGADSPNVERVMEIGKSGFSVMNNSEGWWEQHYAESLQSQLTMLESMVELLQTEIEISAPPTSSMQQSSAPSLSRRVFIVHGHDEAIREAMARFIERLDLTPVILHEQPNKGRTIIEKFTDYTDVGFALVLLTADDRGGPITEAADMYKPRARQNVVLELGFFLGKLGRGRVCALFQEGVEIPSDYSGVLFVKLDNGGAWKFQIARELKAVGIEVDMNKAI